MELPGASEGYYAAPGLRAVLHTVNLRLSPEQTAYTINHTRDRMLILHDSLAASIAEVVPLFDTVEHFVIIGNGDVGDLRRTRRYENQLIGADGPMDWPELDEQLPAVPCYTSGTPGLPKGVAYSHVSHVVVVLDPSRLEAPGAVGDCLTGLLGGLRALAPLDDDVPLRTPGQRAAAETTRRRRDGVPLDPETYAAPVAMADRVGRLLPAAARG